MGNFSLGAVIGHSRLLFLVVVVVASLEVLGQDLERGVPCVIDAPFWCRNAFLSWIFCRCGPCPLRSGAMGGVRSGLEGGLVGQDGAVSALSSAVRVQLSGGSSRPLVLHLAGPTGVGKTESVRIICEEVFESRDPVLGAPVGCVRYAGHNYKGGAMSGLVEGIVDALRLCPHAVFVFDEAQLIPPSELVVLFSSLDDTMGTFSGRAGSARASNATFILISDLGKEAIAGASVDEWSEVLEASVEREMARVWGSEKLEAMVKVIPFRSLPPEALEEVARRELVAAGRRIQELTGAVARFTDELPGVLAERSSIVKPGSGARPLRSQVGAWVFEPVLTRALDRGGALDGSCVDIGAAEDRWSVSFSWDACEDDKEL